jgi:glucose-1-phosphate adenylyltransferase
VKDVMGVISLCNEADRLQELTRFRCTASIPFAGRYRLIDVVLSNMVNSGIEDIAVFTGRKYRSLMDYLGSGREWGLDRKRGGLFILPYASVSSAGEYKGELHTFQSHLDYFHRGSQKYVLIAGSRVVCKIDYRQVIEYHQSTGADITVVYKEREVGDSPALREVSVQEDGKIAHMEERPGGTGGNGLSLDMFVIEKSLLLTMIEACVADGRFNFVRDGIIKNWNELKVYGYRHSGYTAVIDSIHDYYYESLHLLHPEVWESLFCQHSPIYTKAKDEPPVKYASGARVANSLIANGCIIEGTVENSILFRGVEVKKGAHIANSIVMQRCEIGENVAVRCTILDKDAKLTAGQMLLGDWEQPVVIEKRAVL